MEDGGNEDKKEKEDELGWGEEGEKERRGRGEEEEKAGWRRELCTTISNRISRRISSRSAAASSSSRRPRIVGLSENCWIVRELLDCCQHQPWGKGKAAAGPGQQLFLYFFYQQRKPLLCGGGAGQKHSFKSGPEAAPSGQKRQLPADGGRAAAAEEAEEASLLSFWFFLQAFSSRHFKSSRRFPIQMPFSRRYHFLPLLPLLLLASSCQKPSSVHAQEEQQQQQQQHSHRLDDEAIQTQFNPQVETVPLPKPSQQQEAEGPAERERRQAPAGPASGGGGGGNNNVYWLAADGPDFQLWQPAMGAAYGSNGQQQQQAAAMQMSSLGGSQPQQPNVAATTAQQQQQQVAAAAVQQQMAAAQQQQQQQTASSNQQQQQQMMPQQNYQQSMGGMGFQSAGGYGQYGGQQGGASPSPYAAYLEKQISSYPVMIYTLADCIPCQRAKHMLAVHYPDVRAHYLELSGNEPWQQQLQVDLQYMTGAITFPYIFVCGQYIGGSTELFELHESGQLRRLVSQCLQKQPPK